MFSRDGLFDWPIDLGGEFIHGELGLFKKICDDNGIKTIRTFSSFPSVPYFEDGRECSEYVYFGNEGFSRAGRRSKRKMQNLLTCSLSFRRWKVRVTSLWKRRKRFFDIWCERASIRECFLWQTPFMRRLGLQTQRISL